jgi:hypothetical protein
LALGHVLDAGDGTISRNECLVGAYILRDLEFAFRSIYCHNRCRTCQGLEHLDGHLTESACADDDGGRTGSEQMHGAFDGVIAGESGVAERGGLARIKVA